MVSTGATATARARAKAESGRLHPACRARVQLVEHRASLLPTLARCVPEDWKYQLECQTICPLLDVTANRVLKRYGANRSSSKSGPSRRA